MLIQMCPHKDSPPEADASFGAEPTSQASEAWILSIELWRQGISRLYPSINKEQEFDDHFDELKLSDFPLLEVFPFNSQTITDNTNAWKGHCQTSENRIKKPAEDWEK